MRKSKSVGRVVLDLAQICQNVLVCYELLVQGQAGSCLALVKSLQFRN